LGGNGDFMKSIVEKVRKLFNEIRKQQKADGIVKSDPYRMMDRVMSELIAMLPDGTEAKAADIGGDNYLWTIAYPYLTPSGKDKIQEIYFKFNLFDAPKIREINAYCTND
jgi:hypothetical protein